MKLKKKDKKTTNEAKPLEFPSSEVVENELNRVKYKRRYNRTLLSTIYTLITVAAVAILVSMLWMPVLQIYGSSMTPTLADGDIVVAIKGNRLETGDIIAFYYNNKILVKRVIAQSGDWVDLTADGTVLVNNQPLEEPYIVDKAYGDTNIKLPYQVPEGKVFVMGDHRNVSIDSRNTSVGCVAEEQIVGEIYVRVWPFSELGSIK